MQRINVIGTSGSGKSSFSKALAETLKIQYIELDAIYWMPNWQEPEIAEFLDQVAETLRADSWVLDGNQSRTNAIKWQRVDTIIWLDYSFIRTFKQIMFRSIQRAWHQKEIWRGTGNTESFRRNFLSSESVILWMLTNYRKTKRKYRELMQDNRMQHIQIVRLQSPDQAKAFLNNLRLPK